MLRRFRQIAIGQWPGASIQKKLALSFFTLLALILMLGFLNIHLLDSVGTSTREFRDRALPRLTLVNEIERSLTAHASLAKRRLQTNDFRQLATIVRIMRTVEAEFTGRLHRLEQYFVSEAEVESIAEVRRHWGKYLETIDEVLRLSEQGALRRAEARYSETAQTQLNLAFSTLSALGELTRHETDRISQQVEDQNARARRLIFLILTVGLVAVMVARTWISRGVSMPLLEISSSMRSLTEGHDEISIPDLAARTDEIGTLAQAASAFRDSLVHTRTLAQEVENERAWLYATVRNMPIGLAIFGADGNMILANQSMVQAFDLPKRFMTTGTTEMALFAEIARRRGVSASDDFARDLVEMLRRERSLSDIWELRDGRAVEVIFHAMSEGWMLICEDVTDRILAEQNIRRLARTDALTGLANRLAFQERIAAELEAPLRHLTVMLIDLDRFKHTNDTLGHPVGDRLLQQVSERLKWTVGEQDLVARLGGDEFAVISLLGDEAQAMNLGERIVEQMSVPFDIDGHVVQIGGSVGVAMAPLHGDLAEDLMRNADLALYYAKDNGRGNCQFFDPVMNERQKTLHGIEQALLMANFSEELIVVFQPLVDLNSGEISNAEALVRWNHRSRGMISPTEFIPLAEELGLIGDISRIVLEKACREAVKWPKHVKISINLSPAQFESFDVLSDTLAVLETSGLEPRRLELEITETVFLASTERTISTLRSFRDLGVSIALDDFGTGYSSLRYLQAFPFDRVKIDASFVQGVPQDEGAVAIVNAICSLSHTFGFSVTAEGIETEEQFAFIENADVAMGQGYFFSPPIGGDEFIRLLNTNFDIRSTSNGWG